jgi:hypothetical protein
MEEAALPAAGMAGWNITWQQKQQQQQQQEEE